MYVIGGKWKLRIIVALKQGNKRFNDLQRAVNGISARVLSTELKDLELNGFVSRHVYPYTPVTVEYLLTDYTETLEPVLLALGEWGHRHREKVMTDSRNEKAARYIMKWIILFIMNSIVNVITAQSTKEFDEFRD